MSKKRLAMIMAMVIIIQVVFDFFSLGLIGPINRVLYHSLHFGSLVFCLVAEVLLKRQSSEKIAEILNASPWLRVLMIIMICSTCIYLTLPFVVYWL